MIWRFYCLCPRLHLHLLSAHHHHHQERMKMIKLFNYSMHNSMEIHLIRSVQLLIRRNQAWGWNLSHIIIIITIIIKTKDQWERKETHSITSLLFSPTETNENLTNRSHSKMDSCSSRTPWQSCWSKRFLRYHFFSNICNKLLIWRNSSI